jgi:hypothetical protein
MTHSPVFDAYYARVQFFMVQCQSLIAFIGPAAARWAKVFNNAPGLANVPRMTATLAGKDPLRLSATKRWTAYCTG